uniref:Nodule-specific cysteine-rich peptide L65 n=1 Tax=Lens culinaris TaxID=3864 RepID=A0A7T8DVB4_LENCU|nr:nodule-specific cysteine-rich peptide L65 [Lens culinaris]
MDQIVKFVYVMIIFLFQFLAAMNVNAVFKCVQDSDCPKYYCLLIFKPKCSLGWCICVFKTGINSYN